MQVPIEAGGDYKCRVSWPGIHIDSTVATLQVLYINEPPVPTNVPHGADATFSCKTPVSPVPDSITFHYLENAVEQDVPNVVHTGHEATVVIAGVTEIDERDYYCKSSWGDKSVTSTAVALNVLNILADVSSTGL